MKPRTLVMGDLHGALKAFKQCMERCEFDYENDTLIFIGDAADGWSDVAEGINELLKIKNLVFIMGNHDAWLLGWLQYGQAPELWLEQGGDETIASYVMAPVKWRDKHRYFLENKTKLYHIDELNNVYVHGGFHHKYPISKESTYNLMWDRTLLNVARIYEKQGHKFENYRIIFVGHTATTGITGGDEPTFFSNLVMTDTGAGWFGKLTVMDVETFEFWQSDKVEELYPEEHVVRVAKRKKRMKEEEMKENLRFFYENEIKKK